MQPSLRQILPRLERGEPSREVFAELRAQIEELAAARRRNQNADFERAALGVRDVDGFAAPIPAGIVLEQAIELAPDRVDRQREVGVQGKDSRQR